MKRKGGENVMESLRWDSVMVQRGNFPKPILYFRNIITKDFAHQTAKINFKPNFLAALINF